MSQNKQGRKDFLRKLGMSIPGVLAEATGLAAYAKDEELIEEQLEFLFNYEAWLKEFQSFIDKRNENPFDIDNNKRLMELSAQREDKKTTLEMYMKDPKFSKYFNEITSKITDSI